MVLVIADREDSGVIERLERAKLAHGRTAESLEVRNREAISEKASYVEFLQRLLEDEVERRSQKQLSLRLRRSGLDVTKTLESFDFSFNPTTGGSRDFRTERPLLTSGAERGVPQMRFFWSAPRADSRSLCSIRSFETDGFVCSLTLLEDGSQSAEVFGVNRSAVSVR